MHHFWNIITSMGANHPLKPYQYIEDLTVEIHKVSNHCADCK
jgi:hypothetical protein